MSIAKIELALIRNLKENSGELFKHLLLANGEIKYTQNKALKVELLNSFLPDLSLDELVNSIKKEFDFFIGREKYKTFTNSLLISNEINKTIGFKVRACGFLFKQNALNRLLKVIQARIKNSKHSSIAKLTETIPPAYKRNQAPSVMLKNLFKNKEAKWKSRRLLEVTNKLNAFLLERESDEANWLHELNIKDCIEQLISAEFASSDRSGDFALHLEETTLIGNCDLYQFALYELVHNCILHTEKQSLIKLKGTKGKNYYKLLIEDEGKVLSEEALKKIRTYRHFLDSNSSGSRLGMGILLADKIINSFGGALNFEKNEPSGLRVILLFPLNTKQFKQQ